MKKNHLKQLGNVCLDTCEFKHLSQVPKNLKEKCFNVVLDNASSWAYLELHDNRAAITPASFFDNLAGKAPFRIHTLSTDNDIACLDHWAGWSERIKEGCET